MYMSIVPYVRSKLRVILVISFITSRPQPHTTPTSPPFLPRHVPPTPSAGPVEDDSMVVDQNNHHFYLILS